jgi:uncharacterized RDD family membrane protein YckC
MDEQWPSGGGKDGQGGPPPGQGEKKEFDLWRILTTPGEMLETEEAKPARPAAAPSPVPAAVAPEDEAVVYCRKHPETPASSQCPNCAAYYCNDCLIIKRGRLLCRQCAEALYAPTEEEVIEMGEGAYKHSGDFLPQAPPEFNPYAFGESVEGRLSNVFKRLISFVIDVFIARILYISSYTVLSLLLAGLSKGAVRSVLDLGNGSVTAGIKVVSNSVFHYHPILLILLLDFLYFFISFAIANRTPAMSWLNMRIVTVYGDFVGLGACAINSLVLVVTLGFSIIIGFIHPRAMGLHDMAAGVYVVNYSGIKRVDVYETVNVKLE